MYSILKELTAVASPSGHERALCEYISSVISPYVDDVRFDAMGNLIAFKKGTKKNAKKLMLAAHCDELGLMVTYITDDGFIVTAPIGGVRYDALAYTNVVFPSKTKGVIIAKAKAGSGEWNSENLVVDIGCSTRAEAEKFVTVGDVAIYEPKITRLSHSHIAGHAIDDKIGCVILIKAILDKAECVNDTYFVFTVQEEVGLRGSATAAYGIAPDWGIALDVCSTGDIPDSRPMNVKLGGGAAIKVKDSSVICDRLVVEKLIELAKGGNIRYQLEILEHGGTDTASIQKAGNGAMVGGISIPTRYIHTPSESIDMKDVSSCLELTKAMLACEIK